VTNEQGLLERSTITIGTSPTLDAVLGLFPPAPTTDTEVISKPLTERESLEIVYAACGAVDVTGDVRARVVNDTELTFRGSQVMSFFHEGHSPSVDDIDLERRVLIQICILFKYGNSDLRICIAKSEVNEGSEDNTKEYHISSTAKEFPIVAPSEWNAETWSITAIVYGPKLCSDDGFLTKVQEAIRRNYSGDNFSGGKGYRWIELTNAFVGEDPAPGLFKFYYIFYQYKPDHKMQCTIGFERAFPCCLTDRRTSGLYTETRDVLP
jgi:hypothetical protein